MREYGKETPSTWSSRLMRLGNRYGQPAWWAVCRVLWLRERQKVYSARFQALRSSRNDSQHFQPALAPSALSAGPPGEAQASPRCSSGVSVIMPAFNVAHCLERAVRSALQQQPAPLEVIVINDGSTDDTASVARAFGDRITYLAQANLGQGAARNAGLKIARGEFVSFLDADDFWLPGFLAAGVAFLQAHEDAIAVSTGLRFQLSGGCQTDSPELLRALHPRHRQPWVLDDFFSFWGQHDHVRTGSAVIRRSVIEEAGLQQAHLRISQDLEYWAYLGTCGKWGFIPEVLWVCDSENMALRRGWLRKYHARRRLCPTVEQWQERIVRRLTEEDWPGFRRVRGRVAASFAQNHILAGRPRLAGEIVSRYGEDMPASWSARVMRLGHRNGGLTWCLARWCLIAREYQKSVCMRLWSRRSRMPWQAKGSAVPRLTLLDK